MELLIWLLRLFMSQILVYGSIFDTPREWITKKSKFFGDLLGCMMCTSTCRIFSLVLWSPTLQFDLCVPYSNVFFDGMLVGGVWANQCVVEWFEQNRPEKED